MTTIQRVGVIDGTDSCGIYCGKLLFKKLLLVTEAYYWFKLSIFCSLHATCLKLINYYWSHFRLIGQQGTPLHSWCNSPSSVEA